MFDTLAVARTLTNAGIDPAHADALADAIRQQPVVEPRGAPRAARRPADKA